MSRKVHHQPTLDGTEKSLREPALSHTERHGREQVKRFSAASVIRFQTPGLAWQRICGSPDARVHDRGGSSRDNYSPSRR